IIGAGPAGLGAALRLKELGVKDFTVLEKNPYAGGLCASFKDLRGFTWDLGGHVIFSHFPEFTKAFEGALDGNLLEHDRICRIRIMDRWIPYPFQNNIATLPEKDALFCLEELKKAPGAKAPSANFKEWILNTMGRGIAEYFMLPYNFKVWAHPPQMLSKDWLAERVAPVSYEDVFQRFKTNAPEMNWGPNARFKYPRSGGTGAIFLALAREVKNNILYNKEATEINADRKTVTLSSGDTLPYDFIISTAPLDTLVSSLRPRNPALADAAKELLYNGVFSIGVGVSGPVPDNKCWMYFPENNTPPYRVTYLSNYSPEIAPDGKHHAMLCEVSHSAHKPENADTIAQETVNGLARCGMLPDKNKVVSLDVRNIERAYPIPSLGRDAALKTILPRLERLGIFSRGRFGAWRYEAGNTDHCFMQGRQAADRIISGTEEQVWKN
ncbi:MAG: FAD-dependent oxidoreductase, partial [Elusimicrobiaceae bacterium]